MNPKRLIWVLTVLACVSTQCGATERKPSLTDSLRDSIEFSGTNERGDLSDWDDIRMTSREVRFRITHPRTRDKVLFMALAVGAVYLQQNKTQLATGTQALRSPLRDRVSSSVKPLGEAVIPIAAVSTYLIGRMGGSERTRRTGLILAESAAFTVAATELMQFVLSEQRPAEGGQLRFFRSGGHGVSGHTSVVASMSVPLDRLFFKFSTNDSHFKRFGKIIGKTVVYGAPIATGWSRMNDNKHYAWNVLLGLGLGYMVGDFVAGAHEGEAGSDSERARNWDIVPVSDGRAGVGMAVRWRY